MRSYLVFIILFGILATGCGKKLRPDPVAIPAIEANYPTAEIIACGERWHGLAVCPIVKGQPYSSLGIQIQGYHEGIVTIDSKPCQIEAAFSYTGNVPIPIDIPTIAERNCLLTVTVSPKYPDEESQDIRVYSFIGWLDIRVLENQDDEWEGYVRKVTKNFSSEIRVWIGDVDSVRLVADGCGREESYDQSHDLISGWLVFDLKDIVPPDMPPKTCVIEGFARSTVYKDVNFDILLSKYDERFTVLPLPIIEFNGDKLKIKADKAVSIISMDAEYKIDYKTDFEKFDPNVYHVLRLLTVAGRSVLGEWDVDTKKWAWQQ